MDDDFDFQELVRGQHPRAGDRCSPIGVAVQRLSWGAEATGQEVKQPQHPHVTAHSRPTPLSLVRAPHHPSARSYDSGCPAMSRWALRPSILVVLAAPASGTVAGACVSFSSAETGWDGWFVMDLSAARRWIRTRRSGTTSGSIVCGSSSIGGFHRFGGDLPSPHAVACGKEPFCALKEPLCVLKYLVEQGPRALRLEGARDCSRSMWRSSARTCNTAACAPSGASLVQHAPESAHGP